MDIIVDHGNRYGLSFHWDKVEYLCIGCDPVLKQLNGSNVKRVQSLTYLGRLFNIDGTNTSELGKKIGIAMKDFLYVAASILRVSNC